MIITMKVRSISMAFRPTWFFVWKWRLLLLKCFWKSSIVQSIGSKILSLRTFVAQRHANFPKDLRKCGNWKQWDEVRYIYPWFVCDFGYFAVWDHSFRFLCCVPHRPSRISVFPAISASTGGDGINHLIDSAPSSKRSNTLYSHWYGGHRPGGDLPVPSPGAFHGHTFFSGIISFTDNNNTVYTTINFDSTNDDMTTPKAYGINCVFDFEIPDVLHTYRSKYHIQTLNPPQMQLMKLQHFQYCNRKPFIYLENG